MQRNLVYFNGVNANTGAYLTPPIPVAELAQLAHGESFAPYSWFDNFDFPGQGGTGWP